MRLFDRYFKLRTLALCLAVGAACTVAGAQQSPPTISGSGNPSAHNWTTDQILTCTVSECWQLANRNESTFFDIVQQLAVISAQHRGLTLPDNAAAGQRAGEYIKAKAKADRDALLYAIVDASVRHVGTKAPSN
jgi:hypothetical protein